MEWLDSLPEDGAQDFQVAWQAAPGGKCPRCWHFREDIGKSSAHPELCGRCADVVSE